MMKKILLLLTCFCCMFLADGMAFANKVAPLIYGRNIPNFTDDFYAF